MEPVDYSGGRRESPGRSSDVLSLGSGPLGGPNAVKGPWYLKGPSGRGVSTLPDLRPLLSGCVSGVDNVGVLTGFEVASDVRKCSAIRSFDVLLYRLLPLTSSLALVVFDLVVGMLLYLQGCGDQLRGGA